MKRKKYKWDDEVKRLCNDNGITRIKSMSMHYFKALLKLAMNIGYSQALEDYSIKDTQKSSKEGK